MKVMIDNARVLLGHFVRSDWREMHVRTPDGEIFIARHGGGANPMLGSVAGDAAASTAAMDAARVTIAAPHVATVAWIIAPGTPVGDGTVVARLDLLGETVEVSTARAGVVTECHVADGDFVEFEAPLLAISPAS